MQSNWLQAFLNLTEESEFPQACGLNRIIKVIIVHDLHQKKSAEHWINVFAKSKENYFGGIFGYYPQNEISSQKSERSYEPFWRKPVLPTDLLTC